MAQCYQPINIRVQGTNKRADVPCGKCVACLNRKRQGWLFRLENELRYALTAFFVTLTYSDEILYFKQLESDYREYKFGKVESVWGLSKSDVQLFLKRLRHYCKLKGIKYYLVGEYGSRTSRPHYHVLFFNLPLYVEEKKNMENLLSGKNKGKKKIKVPVEAIIQKAWDKGFCHIGKITSASINYTTKYMLKEISYKQGNEKFVLMSKNLGYEWIKRNSEFLKKQGKFYGVVEGGSKVTLPRYYKEKLFSKMERDKNRLSFIKDNDVVKDSRDKDFKEKGLNPYYEEIQGKAFQTIKLKLKNMEGGVL